MRIANLVASLSGFEPIFIPGDPVQNLLLKPKQPLEQAFRICEMTLFVVHNLVHFVLHMFIHSFRNIYRSTTVYKYVLDEQYRPKFLLPPHPGGAYILERDTDSGCILSSIKM